jgi:hypothetical protein
MASDNPSATAAAAATQATSEPADLVLRNARNFSGAPGRPHAAALATSHGGITTVGEDADVAAQIGPKRASSPSHSNYGFPRCHPKPLALRMARTLEES